MKKKQSAGILAYRFKKGDCEVFLIHPGGPLWKKRDKDAWSIPKGEFDEREDASDISSNTFRMEWPPQSGSYQDFPEADKAGWIPLSEAREKMFRGQEPLVDQLAEKLGVQEPE